MATKPPYTVEYAKSNRSKCVACKAQIDKGSVRCGKLERSEKFDGEFYVWRHPDCFFAAYGPTFEELKGSDQLKWEDQEELKKKCPGGDDDESSEEDENEVGWCAQYAKSNRSTCKGCYKKIDMGVLRIGHTTINEDMGYEMTSWYHPECAELSKMIESVDDIDGWQSMKAADKKKVKTLMKRTDKKRKGEEKEKDAKSKKKAKKDAEAKQAAQRLWKCKEELEADYSRVQIQAILKLLKQSAKGGPGDCLARLADVKLYGCLPICPECDSYKLAKEADVVVCHGNLSEWTKCTYKVPAGDVQRKKCALPDDDEIDDKVEEMKEEKREQKEQEKAMVSAALSASPKKPAKKAAKKKPAKAATNWSKQPVKALKAELKSRGLPVSGKKADLVARLEEDDGDDDDDDDDSDDDDTVKALKVDEGSGYTQDTAEVVAPFSCILNQTDLGVGTLGKNSFYKMQILRVPGKKKLVVYTRWGRVGQEGNTTSKELNQAEAIKFFVVNFLQKTGNDWNKFVTGNFEKIPGRAYPVDVDQTEDSDDDDEGPDLANAQTSLQPKVAQFMRLIFDSNTIITLMKGMKIDTKKLPLGKLSKTQVSEGYKVLEQIEKELKKKKPKQVVIKDKSNQFYTHIPHDFGEDARPPPIGTLAEVKEKYDLLNVLGDISIAAGILKSEKAAVDPLRANYNQLNVDLDYVDPSTEEFKVIETYTDNTEKPASHCKGWCMGSGIQREIIDVFRVNRHSEGARYDAHKKVGNRKLLWHGTNAAVVAAIFQGGLRIMPHSGGRVGRGIYLASENNKSASYVQATKDPYNNHVNTGLMFLCEAALGEENCITVDNSSLTKAPTGFDSVLAMGQSEPDPKKDTTMEFDGHEVVIPQGKPIVNPRLKGKSSNFTQSEYLLYKESQVRIRYILKMRWGSKTK